MRPTRRRTGLSIPRPSATALLLLALVCAGGSRAEAFTHEDFDALLARVVDDAGRVDYPALAADPASLERYYARLGAVSPESHPDRFPSTEARLAYWLNAYNAAVLTRVVRRWPLGSVRDVFPPLLGFFVLQRIKLGGRSLSLRSLENDVVRGRFDDPRIHFALNCASIGCPRLPAEAFTAAALEVQLDRETRRFVGERRNVRVDAAADTVHLSSIFKWYDEDFTGWLERHHPDEPATLIAYVRRYAMPDLREALERCASCRVRFIPYDWGINAQPE